MHVFLRSFAIGLLLVCIATSCSTPGKRARQHAAGFHRLSPPDQKLVLGGHVRPGLSQEGVYIAWGEPDAKTQGVGTDKADVHEETWIYRQRVSLYNPMSFYDHLGPSHGYGDLPSEPWLRPGYGQGGIGNEGLLQYRPNVRSLDTLRIAVFIVGKVDRCKDAHGNWEQVPPATDKIKSAAVRPAPSKAHSARAAHHRPHVKNHGAKKAKKQVTKSARASAHHHSPPHHGQGQQKHTHTGTAHHPAAKKHPSPHSGELRR